MQNETTALCPTCNQPITSKKLGEITAAISAEKEKEYAQRYREDLKRAIEEHGKSQAARIAALDGELKGYHGRERAFLEQEERLRLREAEIQLEIDRRVKTEYTTRSKGEIEQAVQQAVKATEARATAAEQEIKTYRAKEKSLFDREQTLKLRTDEMELEIQRRVKTEYENNAKAEIEKAVSAATDQLNAKATRAEDELRKYRTREMDLLEREQAIKFRNEELELEVQRRVGAAQEKFISEALEKTENKYKLRSEERDKTITDMRAKLLEAEAKAQAAGAQLRGDLQEDNILEQLKRLYPGDRIDQIAKSRGGADILQAVISHDRKGAGSILWESKYAQKWSEGWLQKLREDQRKANADIAVLVSLSLPDDQPKGGFREGVLMVRPDTLEEVAPVLRQYLINLLQQKIAGELQDEKSKRILEYLGGKEFNLLLTGIVEDISAFRELDDKEERFILRTVAHRRELRQRSSRRLAQMFGTFQGIMGSLPEVPGLQLLDSPVAQGDGSAPKVEYKPTDAMKTA